MLKRIVVLVVMALAIGAGSLTRSASAAPQASKLAWIGDPSQPDDYGDPDEPDPTHWLGEPDEPIALLRGDPGEPSEGLLQGDPTQPGDGLFNRVRAYFYGCWLIRW